MLPRARLALLPILVCLLPGCFWTEPAQKTSWLKQFNNQAISPDHALIEVALLERPLDDPFINQHLWRHTDELIDSLERHGTLEDNGFRIGQLVGSPSQDLQEMLLAKQFYGYPKAMIFPSGKPAAIVLSQTYDRASFQIALDRRPALASFTQARYILEVVASFASDGRTKLTFTPTVENGEATLPFRASADLTGWELKIEKPCQKYQELSWNVTLGQNQYLLIGGRVEYDQSLGLKMFSHVDERSRVQRLLVIRNCRSISAQDAQQNSVEELMRAGKSPPLALQATMSAVRAKGN